MNRNNLLPLLCFLTLIVLTAAAPVTQAADLVRTKGSRIAGQYLVILRDDAAALAEEAPGRPAVAAVAAGMASAHGLDLRFVYDRALRGFAVRADADALGRLLRDPRVAYVEEDALVYADANQRPATWGLDRIDQRDPPLDGNFGYDTLAAGVHAYVVDTGIRATHQDFGGRVGAGYSAVGDDYGTADCNGHGTHVAGSIGGASWGVAKAVRLHPVRVLGCDGTGSSSALIAGMDWIAAHRIAPAVANLSLGGPASAAVDEAVTRLVGAGVSVVVAAGNDAANACNYSPARAPAALTVGATNAADLRSAFSNFGTCVDLFAPGSSITSAWWTGDTAANTISGTSMASPYVAGTAALYLATHPTAAPGEVAQALLRNASLQRVGDSAGSPNRLLYARFPQAPACGNGGGALDNGVAAADLCAAAGAELRFTLQLPPGAGALRFSLSTQSGDADLYVKLGAPPTRASYDCRADGAGPNEVCSIAAAQAGTYHVLVRAYSAIAGGRLLASYRADGRKAGSNEIDIAIRDRSTVESPISIAADGFASRNARVDVDIKHSYRGDLRVELVAPDGTGYLLKGPQQSDSADDVLASYDLNLSTEPRQGTWKLRVSDGAADDEGYIDSWSLAL